MDGKSAVTSKLVNVPIKCIQQQYGVNASPTFVPSFPLKLGRGDTTCDDMVELHSTKEMVWVVSRKD